MQRRLMMLCAGLCAVLIVVIGVALADPPPPTPTTPPGPSTPDSAPAAAVTGHAPPTGRWSIPSDTGRYIGGYIGGGAVNLRRAEARTPDEGTWGWDYQGWLVPRRVILGWWHGRRYQGGSGAYKTDGPRLYREEEKEK
jgi:hypothetical protein